MITLETFQRKICRGMTLELSSANPAACVLIAPTGSGKTVMVGTVVSQVSEQAVYAPDTTGVVWFWFAPFETIVEQTGRTLLTDIGGGLTLRSLADGRTYSGHRSGDVWISTTALVTNPASKLRENSDTSPSLSDLVSRIRGQGHRIGLVIDEAHLAADNETRFGEVCRDLAPDLFIAATATPKDGRIERLLRSLGIEKRRDFGVPHYDVVRAHLNKSSLRATRMLAARDRKDLNDDLIQDQLIETAWSYQKGIEAVLVRMDLPVSPLFLVQIGNGDEEGDLMRARLKRLTKLKDDQIATYLDSGRTHGSLTSVAVNPDVRALIFKVAAGTGFDAPRAWVLASTRNVDDQDHALQFIGRIMRVQRDVRNVFKQGLVDLGEATILDKAHLVVMDDASQAGFRSAADLVRRIQKEFDPEVQQIEIVDLNAEGDLEREDDAEREKDSSSATLSSAPEGASVILPESGGVRSGSVEAQPSSRTQWGGLDTSATRESLSGRKVGSLQKRTVFGPQATSYADFQELEREVEEQGFAIHVLREGLDGLPATFTREAWPGFNGTSGIARSLAAAVPITTGTIRLLRDQAMGNFTIHPQDVALLGPRGDVIDTAVLIHEPELAARKALSDFKKAIERLPSLTDSRVQDHFLDLVISEIDSQGGKDLGLDEDSMTTLARLFVVKMIAEYQGAESREFSRHAKIESASALPQFIITPKDCLASARNIYSFIPPGPGKDLDATIWGWKEKHLEVAGAPVFLDAINKNWMLNDTEAKLVDVLESHENVLWWARNPVRKPYAVRILKIDGQRSFFYPDFVVGTSWGGRVGPQLIETKYDERDMREKLARGRTDDYGRVIFIAMRDGHLRIVDRHGEVGDQITAEITAPLTGAFKEALAP